MYHFCTYFDRNYLLRGLALHRSLKRHAGEFRLHVLCLDDEACRTLLRLAIPEIDPIPLAALEAADPDLLAVKPARSMVEYYFTCTASFQRYLLTRYPKIDLLTYLDADLYFFDDPAPIFDELGDNSILIVGHRFPNHLRHLEIFGIYNVGLLIFRNDAAGRSCLDWWRRRCIEWCYDRLEDGKFGDQKYLDDWPERFDRVVVLQHKGANLAPWNISGYQIHERNGKVMVDDDPLIFYHFHKLKVVSPNIYDTGLTDKRAHLNRTIRRRIYLPYLRELRGLMEEAGTSNIGSIRRAPAMRLRDRLRLFAAHKMIMTLGPFAPGMNLEPLVRPVIALKRMMREK